MRRIHIVGRKNSGKTTLVAELVREFKRRGRDVGTIKHTHHRHELDTPGKDSHRHRQAGADVVGILSPELSALFFRPRADHDAPERYEQMAPAFAECDLVIVEGQSVTAAPRIEVWRAANAVPALAAADSSIAAVVSDERPDVACPVLPRSDVPNLADRIEQLLGISSESA